LKFSVALPTSYEGLGYPIGMVRDGSTFVRLARAAEALGYDGVWANDHLVTPAFLRKSQDGAPRFYDPLLVLAQIAGATARIRLGTAVVALPLRDPLVLAKQVATLDALSGGRLTLGVGAGADPEEFAAVHPERSAADRRATFDENLAALRQLLDEGGGSYRGRWVRFDDVELSPPPSQRPMPIFIGGHTQRAIERAARLGQGWIPGWRPIAELREWIARLRERVSDNGRAAGSVEVAPELSATIATRHEEAVRRYEASRFVRHRRSRDPAKRDPALMTASNLVGSPEAIRERLAALADAGVDHCAALAFPAETVDELTDQWGLFSAEILSHARR
jgi:probable F420-dependent oxidoreductase